MHYDWKWQLFENAGICMEKLVKPHWSNLFSVGFTHLKPLCHRPCDQPCASRLLRTSAAAASTAAGASVSCAALAPVLSRLYALNLPESKYKQNYWRIFQEITFCIWNTSGKFFFSVLLVLPLYPCSNVSVEIAFTHSIYQNQNTNKITYVLEIFSRNHRKKEFVRFFWNTSGNSFSNEEFSLNL